MAAVPRHVVIVGGGFAGLYAARALAKDDVAVTLVDRKNHHTFQPLLYQVATAGLNPSNIAVPIRRIFRGQRNVEVLLAEVTRIDPDRRILFFNGGGELTYDFLILATGATHSYFGHPEWERFSPGLKTIEDALEIRKRIFFAFEAAEREDDPERHREWMSFAIVGAGPTGVELAGTLAEIAHKTLAKDFRRIDPTQAKIRLLEASPRILASYPPELQDKAHAMLTHLGVEVLLGTPVTAIDPTGVTVGKEHIAARTVLWAAGVSASPVAKTLSVPVDRAGRVLVEPDLTIPGHPEVYVVGDVAALSVNGVPVPGVARAAIEGGRHAANNIRRTLAGKPRVPFLYKNRGSLATIGRGAAIADFGKVKLAGFFAWAAWVLIHILSLIGFKNRLAVMVDWIIAYMTHDRGARLITGELPPEETKRVAAAPSLRALTGDGASVTSARTEARQPTNTL